MRSRINRVSSQGSLVYVTMPSYFATTCIGLLLAPDGGFGLRPEVKHRRTTHQRADDGGAVLDDGVQEPLPTPNDPEIEACLMDHNFRYTPFVLNGTFQNWEECKR